MSERVTKTELERAVLRHGCYWRWREDPNGNGHDWWHYEENGVIACIAVPTVAERRYTVHVSFTGTDGKRRQMAVATIFEDSNRADDRAFEIASNLVRMAKKQPR